MWKTPETAKFKKKGKKCIKKWILMILSIEDKTNKWEHCKQL